MFMKKRRLPLLAAGTVYHLTFDSMIEPTALQLATIASVDWLGDC